MCLFCCSRCMLYVVAAVQHQTASMKFAQLQNVHLSESFSAENSVTLINHQSRIFRSRNIAAVHLGTTTFMR